MTTLLDALKKLATDGSADSVSGKQGTPLPREAPVERPETVTNQPVAEAQPDVVDQSPDQGSTLVQDASDVPRQRPNGALKVVYEDHPRCGVDSGRLPGRSEPSEYVLDLYHQSLVSQPFDPTGLPADSSPSSADAASEPGQSNIDESPVDLVESPFMNREARGNTTPTQIGMHRDLGDNLSYDHGRGDDQCTGLAVGAAAASVRDQTMMAAEIPNLYQVLARNSFDIDPAGGVAVRENDGGQRGLLDRPEPTDDASDMGRPNATPKPTAPQVNVYDEQIADIVRQCQSPAEGQGPDKTAAEVYPMTPPQDFGHAAGSAPSSSQLSPDVVVSESVETPVVPRRVPSPGHAKTEFETLLQEMICDQRKGPQFIRLHRRIQQIVPHPGLCGVVAVQRDAHVAELIGCLGMLHVAAGKNRVLLVDANPDLRRLTDGFELSHLAGLSDVCTGACHYKSAVHRTATRGLTVMPVGTTVELMANWSAAKSVLSEVTREYGLVLVDVGQAHGESTMTIAEACDRILLHVHLGKTHREMARNVADLLFSHNLTVSGVVVTNVSTEPTKGDGQPD